ncbi:hypothetical protein BDV34DRAFT_184120 [Aspergillus parasiticus]|uniref:Uncharacterized protein n=1 Tax=Aspergillus parasiticus TaxID=5067 RepID=A0A5N6E550_ASPPA|nr:hypothetical protein BDV34DRAFT_184120 [Aspergillus parasiticus]
MCICFDKSTMLHMISPSYMFLVPNSTAACHVSTGMLMTDRRGISRRDRHFIGRVKRPQTEK